MSPMQARLQEILEERFQLKQFRPGQKEAISLLMEKNRLLCIQPTGYGKSLLYQLPSCLLQGMTVVISPLLALMRDQMERLNRRFQIRAASLNSDQTEEENQVARDSILQGTIRILFISPEQIDHPDRSNFILNLPVSLLVIDEAHCISTWGHDFRPSYRQILRFSQALKQTNPHLKILALTATADGRVEKDIVNQLSSEEAPLYVWREKMDRSNIHLSVLSAEGCAQKLSLCMALLEQLEGHGLIYCATRENTELVAEYLQKQGISAAAYHAGLPSEEKRDLQQAFSENRYRVISATTALGMGIDKTDVRFILHFDMPGSITAYYQEVGRCGRDGLKADGILLYDPMDRKIQEYLIDSALPSEADFQTILEAVRSAAPPLKLSQIKQLSGLHPNRVTLVLAELIEQGFLKKGAVKGAQIYQIGQEREHLDLSRYQHQHAVKTKELDQIVAYAESQTMCRMATLRKSLGDRQAERCGRCDVCRQSAPIRAGNTEEASNWLLERPVPIAGSKTYSLSDGWSLLDGRLRGPAFVRFMKERSSTEGIDPEIHSLLLKQFTRISSVGAVVSLPSRTWKARLPWAQMIADHFQVPLRSDLLIWDPVPEKRQGELFNNDQRSYNVHDKMKILPQAQVPEGTLLLLDDYVGSGATMKEAARALRLRCENPLIPITIAALKWKLGKPGFI